jgi:predicted cupin superfamily sugar epimerase
MEQEIAYLVEKLELLPHPEGGFYKETYRSEHTIPGTERQLMTGIYFLLTSKNVSRFHRIKSDELWFYHAGSPLIVHTLDENGHTQNHVGLDFQAGQYPQFLVPKNTIFGSSVLNEDSYSLVSCVVAPGFDFEDFELFTKAELLPLFPDHEVIIDRLT